jgi:hypothetical protein
MNTCRVVLSDPIWITALIAAGSAILGSVVGFLGQGVAESRLQKKTSHESEAREHERALENIAREADRVLLTILETVGRLAIDEPVLPGSFLHLQTQLTSLVGRLGDSGLDTASEKVSSTLGEAFAVGDKFSTALEARNAAVSTDPGVRASLEKDMERAGNQTMITRINVIVAVTQARDALEPFLPRARSQPQ